MDLTLPQLQAQMRAGYGSGWTGIAASALAWAVAAGIAWQGSAQHAIWALLAGGALIFPASVVLGKLLGLPCTHPKGNALGSLAGASTFWLIFCLPIAWLLGQQQPAWFFAAMLLVIGGRYLVFASLYGMALYWALGLILAAVGFGLTALSLPAAVIASAGAAIELVFAGLCAVQHYRRR
ncbi:membrane protein [Stenotrophomonas ginsengisoli]|uniref:Membrane protein n=1 Tax=Stenotrophomonas ginsengisoli TaxID=336566 RepID=A0A0R0DB11_9GAMM|nr:hypothetical protein [Stenotrophomonas ginsengisoli]KRG79625.1 membrane protein [Stenotrophomonas ginsengisoli]